MRDLKTSGSNCGVTVVDMFCPFSIVFSAYSAELRFVTQLQQEFLGLPVARGGFQSRQ